MLVAVNSPGVMDILSAPLLAFTRNNSGGIQGNECNKEGISQMIKTVKDWNCLFWKETREMQLIVQEQVEVLN